MTLTQRGRVKERERLEKNAKSSLRQGNDGVGEVQRGVGCDRQRKRDSTGRLMKEREKEVKRVTVSLLLSSPLPAFVWFVDM